MAADANRLAAALDYLERIKRQAVDFGGGVASNLAERAKSAGGLAFEALTSDPNIGRMTTAEFSQAAADRQTPRLDQAAQDLGTISRAIVTQPIQTGKAIVQGEIERAQGAMQSPRAAGEYAGSFIDPARMAAALRKTGPVMAELDVYHGTPHRFPATEANPLGEFDASKIGTGEGAQAYGHGVYLAENPEIASGYRKDLSNYTQPFVQFKGQKIAGTSLSDLDIAAYKYLQQGQKNAGQFPHNTVYYAKKAVENAPDKYWSEKFSKEEILNKINEYGSDVKFGEEKNLGTLYKADLPDEMIDRMLDWDKPLSEQNIDLQRFAPEMRKRIQSIPSSFGTLDAPLEVAADMLKSKTGLELYKMLSEQYGDKAASQKLKDAGIPGIKYLDAGSRGQGGSGTRNFVVFPGEEKKVRILERDGQKAPPQKIAQALEAAPDYRMSHRPLKVEGGAAQLNKAYEVFGQDIYGPNALQYFGAGDPREAKTVAALKRLRDNPDAEVTIYRGVPADATGGIVKGDWVTLDKDVAQDYANLKPGQKGKVLTMKVKAKDVTTWPDSLLEFGYYPAE